MKKILCCFTAVVFFSLLPIHGQEEPQNRWPPETVLEESAHGHRLVRFRHGADPSWGYAADQSDVFALYHPTEGVGPHPLCVMFHSAGGGIEESLYSAFKPDGCDVYHVPDHFYSLHLDCREHAPADWWWGGRNPLKPMDDPDNIGKGGRSLTPVEKRVMAVVRWVIAQNDIDPNRVYLCGNSMGGSGTLGIGLCHGDVFAAVKANVPAGVLHVADRLGFLSETSPTSPAENSSPTEGVPRLIPDPPICVDYSAPNDDWSIGHEILFEGMKARKYPLLAYWGNFGHANAHVEINKVNDLIDSFDWLSVRKNEAYPVFTDATSDSPLPWPDRQNASAPGQVNAFFRWTVFDDSPAKFEIGLRLTDAEELGSILFRPPAESTADVSIRRLQRFKADSGDRIDWSFAGRSGSVQADENGLITIPRLSVTQVPAILTLTKTAKSAP